MNFDDYGSELDGGVTSPVVKNNIYHSITHPYVRLGSVGGTPDVGNNLAYQVQGSAYPGDLWGVDPQFVNVSGKDFHIQSTSPAINTGVTLSTVKDDRDGTPRPQGAGYDRGAYEFK